MSLGEALALCERSVVLIWIMREDELDVERMFDSSIKGYPDVLKDCV